MTTRMTTAQWDAFLNEATHRLADYAVEQGFSTLADSFERYALNDTLDAFFAPRVALTDADSEEE